MDGALEHHDAALLDDVLGFVREPLVVTDGAGKILRASRSAEVTLLAGRPLRGKLLVAYVDPPSRRAFRTALQRPEDATAVPVRLRPRDREAADVVLSLRRHGETIVWRIEQLAQGGAGQPGFVELVESLSDAVIGVDATLTVTTANRPASRVLELVVGEQLLPRWHGVDLRAFALALLRPDAVHAEAHVATEDGTSYSLTGLPSSDRQLAVIIVADTTRQTLRERLEQEFVVNAAHELQTPLTAIVGLVEALTGGGVVEEEIRARFHEHLRRETQRLARLVDALLLLARVGAAETVELEPVPLAPLLHHIGDELAPAAGVQVSVVVPPSLVVRSHYGLLEAVVANLAQNAARHTTAGRIFMSARAGRGTAVLEVRDTGPGMDQETRARAFDRFYKGRARSDGFGLGLAIASRAAEALGGTLELDSWTGVGTTVRLVLPRETTG